MEKSSPPPNLPPGAFVANALTLKLSTSTSAGGSMHPSSVAGTLPILEASRMAPTSMPMRTILPSLKSISMVSMERASVGRRSLRRSSEFFFPCATALYDLPSNAPLWKRGALAFGTVAEAGLTFFPPAKALGSLAERSIVQIAKSASARQVSRKLITTAETTTAVAAERRIVTNSAKEVASNQLANTTVKGARNRFVPDMNATGAHSIFRRDPTSGKVTHYETFQPQTNPLDPKTWQSLRGYDSVGKSHRNKILKQDIKTPHIHDPSYPGGIRYPEHQEFPL